MRGKGNGEKESEIGEGDELDDSLVVKVRAEKKKEKDERNETQ